MGRFESHCAVFVSTLLQICLNRESGLYHVDNAEIFDVFSHLKEKLVHLHAFGVEVMAKANALRHRPLSQADSTSRRGRCMPTCGDRAHKHLNRSTNYLFLRLTTRRSSSVKIA